MTPCLFVAKPEKGVHTYRQCCTQKLYRKMVCIQCNIFERLRSSWTHESSQTVINPASFAWIFYLFYWQLFLNFNFKKQIFLCISRLMKNNYFDLNCYLLIFCLPSPASKSSSLFTLQTFILEHVGYQTVKIFNAVLHLLIDT
jgi:hypothetical protein